MSNKRKPNTNSAEPVVYQIRIRGHLGSQWTDWFGGLTIKLEENGDTLLTGRVVDQAALYGLLRKLRDLGMPLISINHVEPRHAVKSEIKQDCETDSSPTRQEGT